MKECGDPEDTALREICRRIPGTGEESCYLWLQVKEESGKTVGRLEPLVSRTSGCPFRQKVLERIREKKLQSNRSSLE